MLRGRHSEVASSHNSSWNHWSFMDGTEEALSPQEKLLTINQQQVLQLLPHTVWCLAWCCLHRKEILLMVLLTVALEKNNNNKQNQLHSSFGTRKDPDNCQSALQYTILTRRKMTHAKSGARHGIMLSYGPRHNYNSSHQLFLLTSAFSLVWPNN